MLKYYHYQTLIIFSYASVKWCWVALCTRSSAYPHLVITINILRNTASFMTLLGKISRYKLLPYTVLLYHISLKMKSEEKILNYKITSYLICINQLGMTINCRPQTLTHHSKLGSIINVTGKKNDNYLRFLNTSSALDHPALHIVPRPRLCFLDSLKVMQFC